MSGKGLRRTARVEENLRQALAEHLRREYQHDIPGLVSITRVEVSGDLRNGKVFLSFLGDDATPEETVEFLSTEVGQIQGKVGRQLKMKFAPRLSFHVDRGAENLSRVSQLLRDVKTSVHQDDGEDDE